MQLKQINLFDRAFQHLEKPDGCFSMTDNKVPHHFKYIKNQYNWDGLTLFTDHFIITNKVDDVNSKYKIALVIETPETNPELHKILPTVIHKYDFVLTYHHEHLENYSNTLLYPFGGCWVPRSEYSSSLNKTELVNIIYSNKQGTTGHKLRHEIARQFSPKHRFGSGAGRPFDNKSPILKPYMFSVIIENYQSKYYFSEKLLDAIALGVIPIYWGATRIEKFFNPDGIIKFDSIDELNYILANISPELYQSKNEVIEQNRNSVTEYDTQEDWLYKNIFEPRGLI